jgi:hypothetical protein
MCASPPPTDGKPMAIKTKPLVARTPHSRNVPRKWKHFKIAPVRNTPAAINPAGTGNRAIAIGIKAHQTMRKSFKSKSRGMAAK